MSGSISTEMAGPRLPTAALPHELELRGLMFPGLLFDELTLTAVHDETSRLRRESIDGIAAASDSPYTIMFVPNTDHSRHFSFDNAV